MSFILSSDKIKDIDNNLFNFYEENINNPPIVIKILEKHYQITGFKSSFQDYLYYGEYSPADAVNLFTSFINNTGYKELIKIYDLCIKLNADINSVAIFKEKGIKGRNAFEVLKKSSNLPDIILEYISKKDVPLKYTALIVEQSSKVINFIASYLSVTEPSIQNFRLFVERSADFKDIVPDEYFIDFSFPDTRKQSHIEIDSSFNKLLESFKNIKISNADSFETPEINISFNIKNLKEYEKNLELLKSNISDIESFYNLLKKYNMD